jgi:hypothetical protein
MFSVAERGPAAPGVNFTGMVAVPPLAATVMGAEAVVEKSLGFVPVKVSDVI